MIQTYYSSYPSDVLSRNNSNELVNAFGVGAGTLLKVGGVYRLFYLDTSRYTSSSAPACPNSGANPSPGGTVGRWVTRSVNAIEDFDDNPSASGTCILTLNSSDVEVDPSSHVTAVGGLSVIYDSYANRFWLFKTIDSTRTGASWHASKTGSAVEFYVSGSLTGEIDDGGFTNTTVSGAVTDRYGTVTSQYGWYVYVGHTHSSCSPGSDYTCGITHAAVTYFIP